jgi:hypothetical protein
MTIGIDSQNLESYVPVYDVAPETWEEGRPFLVEQLKKLATAVNAREIGFYLDQELLTGKAFIPGANEILDGGTSQQFRTILRKVIDFGTLPNSSTKSVPHGIVFDANFTLIQLWASATDPTNFLALPIPYVTTAAGFQIQLYMDAMNVNIVTASTKDSYTRCFVVIEYIQET